MKSEIFGRTNETGNVNILYKESGEAVTALESTMPLVWPVNSDVSAYYEHPNGIELTKEDAVALGIEVEE